MKNQNSIENIIGDILCKNNITISTAESCTGGMVAAKLISYPGISSVFLEGAVTYSNEAKIKRLGVKEETAKEMAEGIARESLSNASIATTGIAGPSGGTIKKPIGLVYIAIYLNGKTIVKKCNFSGDRNEVRTLATNYAINMMIKELKDNNYE